MQVRAKNIKREIVLVPVPNNATVKDLREGLAKINQVDYQRIKVIAQAQQLNDDNLELSKTPIRDATQDANNFCMYLIGQAGQVSKPAPVTPVISTTPVTPVASTTQVPTQTQASTQESIQTIINQNNQINQVSEDSGDSEESEDAVDISQLPNLLAGQNLDINELLQNPDFIQSVLQFRLKDPAYVQAYSMFPDETQALLSNKAFLLISMSDMVHTFANLGAGTGAGGGGQRQINISWLPDEGDDKKQIFKEVVEMGYDPVNVIQALRACSWDVGASIDLLIIMKTDDIAEEEKAQKHN